MNLQFTSSHTRVYISEMTGTVFRAPCQTCLSVFPTGESAEPPFTMRKEGLVTIVTRPRTPSVPNPSRDVERICATRRVRGLWSTRC